MATVFKDKVFHYARVSFIKAPTSQSTLQGLAGQVFRKLGTLPDRSISFDDGRVIQPQHQTIRTSIAGSRIHLSSFVPKEHATTVPYPKKTDVEMDLGSATPPTNTEFMDGEAFLLISGQNVIVCSTHLSDSLICRYFDAAIQKSGLASEPTGMSLARVANLDHVEMIRRFGVKSIALDASIYEASDNYLRRRITRGRFLGNFYAELRAMMSVDEPVATAIEHADLQTKVVIKLPGRNRTAAARNKLSALTERLVQEDGESGVEIELGNGIVLASQHVTLRKHFKVRALHKGLNHNNAFERLDQYFDELNSQNLIET